MGMYFVKTWCGKADEDRHNCFVMVPDGRPGMTTVVTQQDRTRTTKLALRIETPLLLPLSGLNGRIASDEGRHDIYVR
jgi:hypothetical protein